jgi:hypothetical protein
MKARKAFQEGMLLEKGMADPFCICGSHMTAVWLQRSTNRSWAKHILPSTAKTGVQKKIIFLLVCFFKINFESFISSLKKETKQMIKVLCVYTFTECGNGPSKSMHTGTENYRIHTTVRSSHGNYFSLKFTLSIFFFLY